ncbi:MAG: hypothetical protein J0M04_23705 [Verrucomicrobia bacterium]|nr:hypothetical protein [Verrucomicrobiota bacterium]
MKFHGAEIPTLLALMALVAVADNPAEAPPQAAAGEQPSITDLITSMADESFPARENATRKLWEMGDAAIPALKQAAEGTDPEIAFRARDILRKLELFILPGTDPAVISLVERYKQANPSQKPNIMEALRAKRAYRQVLKLYAAETDAKLRNNLKSMVEGLASFAAREAILAGNAAEARTMLELAPAEDQGLMTLAAFHRANGTLKAELERAKSSKAPGAAAWRAALHRAAGNIAEARNAAVDAGKPEIASLMAMFEGDPLPWLEFGSTRNPSSLDLYTPLAIKRWNGRIPGTPDIAGIVNRLNSRNTATRALAFGALSLLGEPSLAESSLAKVDPLSAFDSLDSNERVEDALKALHINPEKPDYTQWAASRFAQLLKDSDEAENETIELAALANFLESRGLHKELREAFDKPLAELAEKDIDAFSEIARAMCGRGLRRTGAIGPILRVAPEWAGDDDDRWDDILVAVFGDNDDTMASWTLLSQIDPKASRKDRFAGMCAMAGLGIDPDGLRKRWLTLLWKHVAQTPPGQRPTVLKLAGFLLGSYPDLDSQLKLIDLREKGKPAEDADEDEANPEEEVDPMAEDLESGVELSTAAIDMVYLAAADRWNEAAQLALKLLDANKGRAKTRADLHAYAAACLRRAGKEKEAAAHEIWVEKLALGESDVAKRIAGAYAFGDDYERSATWWWRAVLEADPGAHSFVDTLDDFATLQLERGKWKLAAASFEVVAQLYGKSPYGFQVQTALLRIRQQADLARAMDLLQTDRERAVSMLARCHGIDPCGATLADHFFPALRAAGLTREHDRWFQLSWDRLQSVIKRFPGSHNTRNSAAWLAARAARKLDAAQSDSEKALAICPDQGAYLDTMAEIQFAKGRREEAISWSERAIKSRPTDSALRRQLLRFRNDPFPK